MTAQDEPIDEDLCHIAKQIDAACHQCALDTLTALDQRCADLLRDSTGARAARLWYYRSNIQACFQQISEARSWRWRQPHRERGILYLRRARSEAGFARLDLIARAQITTNLANHLNHLGRGIEAIRLHDETLRRLPGFAMAIGNRGLARRDLAGHLANRHHVIDCLTAALADLEFAVSRQALWDGPYPDAIQTYNAAIEHIQSLFVGQDTTPPERLNDNYPLGRSKKEHSYRRWALQHQLFLNPINVLGNYTFAAADDINLPDHRAPLDEPPHYIAWFNQLKQEFVAARVMLFEAEHDSASHYGDNKVALVDTLDYSAFGIAIEKMRIAFRLAYGLLDKVAGFINAYFKLGMDPAKVDFRNVWLTSDRSGIRDEFAQHNNWPLRGLYWLAFDIVDRNKPGDPDAIAPEAKDLNALRNTLEHRCLILRDGGPDQSDATSIVEYRTVPEFRDSTLHMLSLARAALFYLAFAVRAEERLREADARGPYVPRELPIYRGRRPSP